MPKETFFNLPEKKRRRIIKSAEEEFAAYPFRQASVARIIKRSGIASGSFYQYFRDKFDLYEYITESFFDMKLRRLAPLISAERDRSFFDTFKDLYAESLKLARENPRLEAISGHLYRDKELLSRQLYGIESRALGFYREMLKRGIRQGDLKKDIDIEFTSYILFKLGASVNEYIMERTSLKNWDMKIVDRMIDFMEDGIGKKGDIITVVNKNRR